MTDRRYTDEEVKAIFSAAAEAPQTPPHLVPREEGLTLGDLQEIGREVGIPSETVAEAVRSVELRGQAATQTLLRLPIGVEHTVALNRWLTDEEWQQLVVELRQVFRAKGIVRSSGSLREWTNGNLQALLEPTESGHRLVLRTIKGDARASMMAGLAMGGISGAVAIASALGGQLGHAVPGIAFLGLAGLGIFASGALRVPTWARVRARQMEGIARRLTLPPRPPSTPPPLSSP